MAIVSVSVTPVSDPYFTCLLHYQCFFSVTYTVTFGFKLMVPSILVGDRLGIGHGHVDHTVRSGTTIRSFRGSKSKAASTKASPIPAAATVVQSSLSSPTTSTHKPGINTFNDTCNNSNLVCLNGDTSLVCLYVAQSIPSFH